MAPKFQCTLHGTASEHGRELCFDESVHGLVCRDKFRDRCIAARAAEVDRLNQAVVVPPRFVCGGAAHPSDIARSAGAAKLSDTASLALPTARPAQQRSIRGIFPSAQPSDIARPAGAAQRSESVGPPCKKARVDIQSVSGRLGDSGDPLIRFETWSRWKPEQCQKSGMGHLLVVALNRLRKAGIDQEELQIVLQVNRTQYGAKNTAQNLWEDFFQQPCGARQPQKTDDSFDGSWHPGGSRKDSPIDVRKIGECRNLVQTHFKLTPTFQKFVQKAANEYLEPGRQYLACHVRTTDKGCEAPEIMLLTIEGMADAITSAAARQGCDGVLLCADARIKKRELSEALEDVGWHVATYPSALPESGEVAPHMDLAIDKVRKGEDIVTELMLMALFCRGLISTRSNVSTLVVAMAPAAYYHIDFWGHETTLGVSLPASVGRLRRQQLLLQQAVSSCHDCQISWLDKDILCLYFPRRKHKKTKRTT